MTRKDSRATHSGSCPWVSNVVGFDMLEARRGNPGVANGCRVNRRFQSVGWTFGASDLSSCVRMPNVARKHPSLLRRKAAILSITTERDFGLVTDDALY